MDEKHKLLENFEKIWKIFDENSIEKLNFYLFLGKFVAKNRNFGNNIIFLQQFFPVRGGGSNPPPAYATAPKDTWTQKTIYEKCSLRYDSENGFVEMGV